MELREAIENRRSCRKFNKKDISNDIITDLLDCGRLAPSAKNRQPWFFVIVKGKIKNKIADCMIDWSMHMELLESQKNIKNSSSVFATANIIKDAPVLILVLKEKDDSWIVGDSLSIGACIENIILRATDVKIGSLWIRDTVHVAEQITNIVGYPNLELSSAIALGYTNSQLKQRPRKELEEMIRWYE